MGDTAGETSGGIELFRSLELPFEGFLHGGIGDELNRPFNAPVGGANRRERHRHVHEAAVAALAARVIRRKRLPVRDGLRQPFGFFGRIGRKNRQPAADNVVRRPSENAFSSRIPRRNGKRAIEGDNGEGTRFDKRFRPRKLIALLLLGATALAQVTGVNDQPRCHGVRLGAAFGLEWNPGSIGSAHSHFDVPDFRAPFDLGGKRLECRLDVVRVQQ